MKVVMSWETPALPIPIIYFGVDECQEDNIYRQDDLVANAVNRHGHWLLNLSIRMSSDLQFLDLLLCHELRFAGKRLSTETYDVSDDRLLAKVQYEGRTLLFRLTSFKRQSFSILSTTEIIDSEWELCGAI